ncbi:MAG: 2,3-dihydroxybiphenyl 1,2-dioxygenase [Gammaproteobacteria bacterium]|nr:2,3-dihydroxybiphenyl 1,2-dioxygenase [Gammaproteobacteria bacterium]
MDGITELGYVRFDVSDLSEWQGFASSILGLEVVDEGEPGKLYLRTDSWHHRIVLEQGSKDDLAAAGLRVAGAEEFADMQQRLQAAGVKYEVNSREQAEQCRVLEVMSLSDPAGNPLEIFHGPEIETHKPFYPGRRMHGRYLTGDGGLGHMILRNRGLDDIFQFYRLLGMRGGIEYKIPTPDGNVGEMLFMHCNSRDHTLAFGPSSGKHINHLMLEVDNLDDVFMTYDLVQASNYPIMISPGRHANDQMFSFYFATPSRWLVEIGWGARPATHQSEYYTRDTYGHEMSKKLGPGMSID